jgi:L-seryl-tRNA(Ser) seleniumtransferase
MQVAALGSVLADHAAERGTELPVWRMLRESADQVHRRAARLAEALDGDLEGAHVVTCTSSVGGGSLPGYSLPSFGVEVRAPEPEAMSARLRSGSPPVFCRVTEKGVVFDLRTVPADAIPDLTRAIQYASEGDDLDDA